MNRTALCTLPLALTPATAQADALRHGTKGITTLIRLEATVPAGKVLVLGSLGEYAERVEPGKDVQVHHSNRQDPPKLFLLSEPEAATIIAEAAPPRDEAEASGKEPTPAEIKARVEAKKQRRQQLDEQAQAFNRAGALCADSIERTRAAPDTSAYDTIRMHYAVKIDGASCSATVAKKEYLTAAGAVVAGPDGEPAAPPTAP